MSLFLLLNTKEDILKKFGNQRVVLSYMSMAVWLPTFFKTSSFAAFKKQKQKKV